VAGDAGEPGGEQGLAAEAGELAEGPQIGFLHDVLGLRVVRQDATGDAEEPLVVAPHQDLEKRDVPRQHALHDLLVGEGVGEGRGRGGGLEGWLAHRLGSL
jgi:hypothetical protein